MGKTMTKLPLESAWEAYERQVASSELGADQRLVLKRAFYAGASAVDKLISGPVVDGDDHKAMNTLDALRCAFARFRAFS